MPGFRRGPGLIGTAVIAGGAAHMGSRHAQKQAAAQQQEAEQEARIAELESQQTAAAASAEPAEPDYMGELEQLAQLKAQGVITEEEFEAKKKQILGI